MKYSNYYNEEPLGNIKIQLSTYQEKYMNTYTNEEHSEL